MKDLSEEPRAGLKRAGEQHIIFANIENVRDTRPYGGPGDQYAANLNGSDPNRTIGTALR